MWYFVLYIISILSVSHRLSGMDPKDPEQFPPLCTVSKPEPKKKAATKSVAKPVPPTPASMDSEGDRSKSKDVLLERANSLPSREALDSVPTAPARTPSPMSNTVSAEAPSAEDIVESEDGFELIERGELPGFAIPTSIQEDWWHRGPYSHTIAQIKSGKFNKENSRDRRDLIRALDGMVRAKNGRALPHLIGLLCEHGITVDDTTTMHAVRAFLREERKKQVACSQGSIDGFINKHNEKRTERMQKLNHEILELLQQAEHQIARDEERLEEAINQFDVSYNCSLKAAINGTNGVYPLGFDDDSESDSEVSMDPPISHFMKKYGLNVRHKQAIEESEEMRKKVSILGKVTTKHLTHSDG